MMAPKHDDQRLSALLAGRLEGPERDELLAYLATADEDYFVVVNTGLILRELEEEESAEAPLPAPRALFVTRDRRRASTMLPSLGEVFHHVGRRKDTRRGGEMQKRTLNLGKPPEHTRSTGIDLETLWEGNAVQRQIAEFAGGLLSSWEVAERLQISPEHVTSRLSRRELLAVPLPDGRTGFPALQFQKDNRLRIGVPEVAKAGAHVDPWVLISILVDDVEDDFGGILLERLNESVVLADVLNRLATYGTHGAA
jgi:hypothetical protein